MLLRVSFVDFVRIVDLIVRVFVVVVVLVMIVVCVVGYSLIVCSAVQLHFEMFWESRMELK